MLKIFRLNWFSNIQKYYSAFRIRLSYGHSTMTAARLAYLEIN